MKDLTALRGKWNEKKGRLKQKLAKLIDNDFLMIEGKQDEILGGVQRGLLTSTKDLNKSEL